jgi:hypothetical protein
MKEPDFKARGSLDFISDWKPVLTNPSLQLAQESMTGWKEVCGQQFCFLDATFNMEN